MSQLEPEASPSRGAETSVRDALLPHESHNDSAASTILLIHGAFTTSKTFAQLLPWLSSYHVLIPTLPGHGTTKEDFGPLTLANTTERLAELVLARGHRGQAAAVAGHSMGAMVGAHLAAHRPEVVGAAVWLSGAAFLPRSPLLAWGFALNSAINVLVPTRLIDSLIDVAPELRGSVDWGDTSEWAPMSLRHEVAAIMSSRLEDLVGAGADADADMHPTGGGAVSTAAKALADAGIRAAVIAATKGGGLVPSNDSEDVAAAIARALGGTAWRVPTMRHAWNLQDPKLFAMSITGLVEGREAPPEFERI